MIQRKIHRILGLIMLLPLIAWASTGIIFLTKPGYGEAYQSLNIPTYDLEDSVDMGIQKGWKEVRLLKSVLGVHLLVNTGEGFKHYSLKTLSPAGSPKAEDVRQLVSDAMASNIQRYGEIEKIDGLTVHTNTGVEIQLDWNEMTLRQKGDDRRVIETLYKIHYLQWTKWESVNNVLGVVGLFCLVSLTLVGLWTYLSNKKSTPNVR